MKKAINPNTAKNIFVFTDGKNEKKNGKKKKLVSIVITDTCITFSILNQKSSANVCCKTKKSFIYDAINKAANHLVM